MALTPLPELLEAAEGKRTVITIHLDLPSRDLAMAEPLWGQVVLSNAALAMADDEPNKAVALLVGAALEASMRGDEEQAVLALGAVVHRLKVITEAQVLGGIL